MPLYRNESVPHPFHWKNQKVWIEAVDQFFHFHLCVMKSSEWFVPASRPVNRSDTISVQSSTELLNQTTISAHLVS